jgi:acyl carrier protein phosphodiesterase
MNWLAHVYLSEPDVEFRLGNLLADLVKGRDRNAMPPRFLDGVKRHQEIDSFTDSHPVVHRSRGRVSAENRRFAGILVDVFYDHYLALDWDRYCDEPLDAFTKRLYAEVRAHPIALPAEAQAAVNRMLADDRLGFYRQVEGIEAALRRVSIRLAERVGRDFALERMISELHANFDGLKGDFTEFFPQLQAHVT